MPPTPPRDLLALQAIHKRYATPVLTDVHLQLRAGEVHALVGANGAGKSTLARIVAGITSPERGVMALGGQPYSPRDRRDADRLGVQMVMQELNLLETLSVAENIYLDRLPGRWGFISRSRLAATACRDLAAMGLEGLDPATPVHRLGVGEKQLVEIAATLARPCRVLILDEPTAALTDPQIDLLFDHLRRLRKRGVGILYISHRMEEIGRIADRVTVLRDGRIVMTRQADEITLEEIIRGMVGQRMARATRAPTATTSSIEKERAAGRRAGDIHLRVQGLSCGSRVREVSFEVHRGEILGLAGLVGAGRTETLRALFGADRATRGQVYLAPGKSPLRIRHPADAVRAGIGMIPEDRKADGLLLPRSLRVNITLATVGDIAHGRAWIAASAEREVAERIRDDLSIQCDTVEKPASELSGGNQQKAVIGRWLLRDCSVLLFDEPTRGIDVAAKSAVYRLLGELTGAGKALVVASSDLQELMAVSDRIAVFSAGELVRTFERPDWSQERILAAAFQGHLSAGAAARRSSS